MAYSTIIFDFDGTIADTFSAVVEIANGLSKEFGFEALDMEEISALRHKRAQDLLKIVRIPFWRIPKFIYTVKTKLGHQISSLAPINGMPEALERLSQNGYRLGIVSSNNEETIQAFLTTNNLHFFDFVFCEKDLFGKGKVLKRLVSSFSLDRENTVYVGDETRDIEAARYAHIAIISVAWGFNAYEALELLHPDFIISEPDELFATVSSSRVL
jgi:phosphoglycolate phosphatase